MNHFHGLTGVDVNTSTSEVFDLITDVDRLPEWNDAIERVVERPAQLAPGLEWVVVMHPHGLPPWKSRSHLDEIEPGRRFAYTTRSDDGNPSYALWRWDLTPIESGSHLSVSWDVYPKTIGRKLLAAPLRRRMLARETVASLDNLRRTLEHARSSDHVDAIQTRQSPDAT